MLRFCSFSLVLLLAAAAASLVMRPSQAAVDEKRLRHVIPYPYLNIGYVFGDGGNGMALGYPKPMSRSRLRQAQETLKREGEDGPLDLRIAKLYWDMGSIPDGVQYADKAEQIFRNQLVAHPDDPEIQSSLAESICLTGHLDEAVDYIKPLTEATRDKWQLWAAESFVYRYAGYFYLIKRMKFARVTMRDEHLEQESSEATTRPVAADLEYARSLFKTGEQACDRAVELAPERGEVYANRATFKCIRDEILFLAQPRAAGDANSSFKILYEPSIIADYKSEVEADDTDDFAKIRVSYLNCLNVLTNGSQLEFEKGQYWKDLEPNKRKIVDREVSHLLTLGKQSKDAITAAEVQSMLALIHMIQGQFADAKTCLRVAVTEDPDRSDDWERLTSLLIGEEDFATLASMTKARLHLADTMRNRLILTVASTETDDAAEALSNFNRLQSDFGGEPKVHLLEIALLLKRTDSPKRKELLARVGDLLSRYQFDDFEKRDRQSFTLLTGIYEAMTGSVGKARQHFAEVLKADPQRGEATVALAALGR